MEILIDANVFCRLVRPDDPQHPVARQAVEVLLEARHTLVLTPQIEREFWAVATRPRELNGLGLTSNEAEVQLHAFEKIASFKADVPTAHDHWRQLVAQYQVLGKKVHDASHVAAMLAHAIRDILTFDALDFRRYDQLITVYTPEQVVSHATPQQPEPKRKDGPP